MCIRDSLSATDAADGEQNPSEQLIDLPSDQILPPYRDRLQQLRPYRERYEDGHVLEEPSDVIVFGIRSLGSNKPLQALELALGECFGARVSAYVEVISIGDEVGLPG
eukprot:TRINITY_DN5242_c0_g1_i1.p2 TRINITY_DN5242_c0_g1~~TRINITY_DN5242_c0_g1_i1.p2  ORF type:complete len:108 (-),score=20.61 TRINITY_DN5242_c0_g1_i1:190-513(-)